MILVRKAYEKVYAASKFYPEALSIMVLI